MDRYIEGKVHVRRTPDTPRIPTPRRSAGPQSRSGEEEMAKSASHPWEKAHPSQPKGAFKKAFCAFFIICVVQTPRTSHEQQPQSTRTPSVKYFTETQHDGAHITPKTVSKTTFIDANTRENFPEALPKGPGSKHFRALAGHRPLRTLGSQGLASRPPKLDNENAKTEKKTSEFQQTISPRMLCNTLTIEIAPITPKTLHRPTVGDISDHITRHLTASH
jgi:hypothetical protein